MGKELIKVQMVIFTMDSFKKGKDTVKEFFKKIIRNITMFIKMA